VVLQPLSNKIRLLRTLKKVEIVSNCCLKEANSALTSDGIEAGLAVVEVVLYALLISCQVPSFCFFAFHEKNKLQICLLKNL
jgi:hypothetical protein